MFLTRNDLAVADHRPDVTFALSLETTVASNTMVAEMEGLYQVPVDLVSDWFVCQSSIHAELVAEMNAAFTRIHDGGGMGKDLVHISGSISEWYERMLVLDLKRIADAPPRAQAQ